MKTAIILAAGRGMRLGSLTEKTPKCLLRVGGLPILHHQLSALEKNGVMEAVVVVGFMAETIRDYMNVHFSLLSVVFLPPFSKQDPCHICSFQFCLENQTVSSFI